MVKDLKKLKPSERRKLRAKLTRAAQTPTQIGGIPLAVAIPEDNGDEGDRFFTVGHQFYKDSYSVVKSMPPSSLRKIIEGYRNIARCLTEPDIYDLPGDFKKITIDNHYKRYASGLTPDVELSEFDAGEHRGFFFIDNSRKIVQMIAIDAHPEDKKQKK